MMKVFPFIHFPHIYLLNHRSFLEDKDEDENGGTNGSSPSLNAGAEGIDIEDRDNLPPHHLSGGPA